MNKLFQIRKFFARKFFGKDLSLKVLSVFFAVLLWIYVVNVNNPITTKVVSVPLRYVNEDILKQKGISLRDRDYENVIVTVKGRQLQLQNISENSFQPAILDLGQIDSVDNNLVPIIGPKYIGKENIEIISISPQVKKLDLEKLGKRNVNVQVVRSGSLKDKYRIISVEVTPKAIAVEGFESVINQVEQIRCTVKYENLDRDTTFRKVPCTPLNKQGVEIKGVVGNFYADVTIRVAKEVDVVPEVKGTPADNYMVRAVSVTPEKVLITGNSTVLAATEKLSTEPVDISKADESFSVNKNIVLPQGVNLYNSPGEVKVNVDIEALEEKTIVFTSEDIAILNMKSDNSLDYYITTPRIIIVVRGEKELIDKLTQSELNPRIDVKGLEKGFHTLPLSVDLPEGVKLDRKYSIDVIIEERNTIRETPAPEGTDKTE